MASSFQAAVKRYLKAADQARTRAAKGKAFEDLAGYLFGSFPGISISQRNAPNDFESEEIDIAFWNEQHPRGLKSSGAGFEPATSESIDSGTGELRVQSLAEGRA
jgi:hypothetical protein